MTRPIVDIAFPRGRLPVVLDRPRAESYEPQERLLSLTTQSEEFR